MKSKVFKSLVIILLSVASVSQTYAQGCSADFSYETDQLTINCTDLSTGLILTSFWDFGDGSNPGIDPFHTYAEPGEYEVCLTVGNIIPFCFDSYCEMVTVVDFTCEPTFDYSRKADNLFSFTNTTTVGNVDSVFWEFGDGNSSAFANPSYTYNAAGTYEVCLTTFDGDNVCGISCQDIDVFPLGLDEVKNTFFSVYPNPTDGRLELRNSSAFSNLEIRLYDISGRLISSQSISNAAPSIHLNYDLPSGIYMLDIDSESGAGETFRVVVAE